MQDLYLPHAHLCIRLAGLGILDFVQVYLIHLGVDHDLHRFTDASSCSAHAVARFLKCRFLQMSRLSLHFGSQDLHLVLIHQFNHLSLLLDLCLHFLQFLFC